MGAGKAAHVGTLCWPAGLLLLQATRHQGFMAPPAPRQLPERQAAPQSEDAEALRSGGSAVQTLLCSADTDSCAGVRLLPGKSSIRACADAAMAVITMCAVCRPMQEAASCAMLCPAGLRGLLVSRGAEEEGGLAPRNPDGQRQSNAGGSCCHAVQPGTYRCSITAKVWLL